MPVKTVGPKKTGILDLLVKLKLDLARRIMGKNYTVEQKREQTFSPSPRKASPSAEIKNGHFNITRSTSYDEKKDMLFSWATSLYDIKKIPALQSKVASDLKDFFPDLDETYIKFLGQTKADTDFIRVQSDPLMADEERLLTGVIDKQMIDVVKKTLHTKTVYPEIFNPNKQSDSLGIAFTSRNHFIGIDILQGKVTENDHKLACIAQTLISKAFKNAEDFQALQYDELSGFRLLGALYEQIDGLIQKSKDNPGHKFSVIVYDLDHLKDINGSYGHQAGDDALKANAETVKKNVRAGEMFKTGGDEFAIVLDGVGLETAVQIAERVRKAVEGLRIKSKDDFGHNVTFKITDSMGVFEYSASLKTAEEVRRAADLACIAAKGELNHEHFGPEGGRNRTVYPMDGNWVVANEAKKTKDKEEIKEDSTDLKLDKYKKD